MATADPFITVKEEVTGSLKETEALFARWQQLLDGGAKDEFEWVTNELQSKLKSISWDLEDLEETISIVETTPSRFNIGPGELAERKKFVSRTKERANEIRSTIVGSKSKAKQAAQSRSALMSGGGRYAKLDRELDSRNDDFIADQSQQQAQIMREQDEQLSQVGETIGVLKNMGTLIGNELDDQNQLLEEFDADMETTSDRLKHTLQRLDKVMGITKDGKQSCCICLLILILIILDRKSVV